MKTGLLICFWAIVWVWASFFVGKLIGIDFVELQWWHAPYVITSLFILLAGLTVITDAFHGREEE